MDDIKQRIELGKKKMTNWLSQDQHEDEVRYEINTFFYEERIFTSNVYCKITKYVCTMVSDVMTNWFNTTMESKILHANQVQYAEKIIHSELVAPYQLRLLEFKEELNSRVNLSNTSET